MITHDVEQNSDAWFKARQGIVTASSINKVLSKGRGKSPSVTRHEYMMKLLAERVTDIEDVERFTGNTHTERGHIQEPEARTMYSFLNDVEPELVGFVTTDDGLLGASPDSLLGDKGCLEIKSKLPHIHLPVYLSQELPKEHEPQVQTQLYVAEREWCDFISYWPGLPLVQIRVNRDEERIKEIVEAVNKFNEELFEYEQKVKQAMAA
jgi:putative phage-type endonuclease